MRVLITGGAGFIGCNAAHYFLERGDDVTVFDNLSRKGARHNLDCLLETRRTSFVEGDVRDGAAVRRVVAEARPDAVLHLAGQVAVTASVTDPRTDFEVNALGTLNVLEAVRTARPEAIVLYASTNKVYGELGHRRVVDRGTRYAFDGEPPAVGEAAQLDFYSPYGCSKGAADQYVRDYSRIYRLRTAVLRLSCVYGPRQFGVEDQGWVSWFIIAAALGARLTLYGDGKQVRDVLFIDDLLRLFELMIERADSVSNQVFNVGGGPAFQLSLLELIEMLEGLRGHRLPYDLAAWRPGDQRVYVSDIGKAGRMLGWTPKVSPAEGVERVYEWVRDHIHLVKTLAPVA
jgi:CDP-paratose 2-epimerase